ncbi:MAG: dipeptide ABC transporter ATP-binding protein [Firmicutes bacterium]|nr:dipeptide ABC transporter ATP-binding protein [Bacillota bacterium]
MAEKLLEIKNLQQYFPVKGLKGTDGKPAVVKAVDGVTFDIYKGEVLGLVGESGCGKTTIGRCILRLVEPTGGEVLFNGIDVLKLKDEEMRKLRQEMQIVFQDPYGSLDPRKTVGQLIGRPLELHRYGTKEEIRKRTHELMELVGLRPEYYGRFPHEFSGGQRQRIGIARAIALNPQFVVCDEPVSALDVSIQAQVLNLMKDLQEKFNLTYLFISHDLRVVRYICDRVIVMYLGRIMEIADSNELYDRPVHPYTKALLSAIPEVTKERRERERVRLQGDVPSPINIPGGCRFHTRCPQRQEICKTTEPPVKDLGNGHFCVCHFA